MYQINYDNDLDVAEYDSEEFEAYSDMDDSEDDYCEDPVTYEAPYTSSFRHWGGEHTELAVTEVRYTHAVISPRFRTENRGDHTAPPQGPLLQETFRQLVENPADIENIPRVPVMRHQGHYWAVNGNRRLFIYKSLHTFGLVDRVPVRIIPYDAAWFEKAHSTKNDGKAVKVYGVNMTTFEAELKKIYLETRHGTLAAVAQNHQNQDRDRLSKQGGENIADFRKLFEAARQHRKEVTTCDSSPDERPQTRSTRPVSRPVIVSTTVGRQVNVRPGPSSRPPSQVTEHEKPVEVARIQPRIKQPDSVANPIKKRIQVTEHEPQMRVDVARIQPRIKQPDPVGNHIKKLSVTDDSTSQKRVNTVPDTSWRQSNPCADYDFIRPVQNLRADRSQGDANFADSDTSTWSVLTVDGEQSVCTPRQKLGEDPFKSDIRRVNNSKEREKPSGIRGFFQRIKSLFK